MAMALSELKYTQEHEWVVVQDGIATIGITDYAQDQLGDVVFIDLPEIGAQLKQFEAFGVVESVKAASDLCAPISGTVVEINQVLTDQPELLNQSPYEAGWIVKVQVDGEEELAKLLSSAEYEAFVASLS